VYFHLLLRWCACDWIDNKKNEFRYLNENHTKKMRKYGEWGTAVEIKALSDIFERDIFVMNFQGSKDYDRQFYDSPKIYLCYNGFNHYDCLVPEGVMNIGVPVNSPFFNFFANGISLTELLERCEVDEHSNHDYPLFCNFQLSELDISIPKNLQIQPSSYKQNNDNLRSFLIDPLTTPPLQRTQQSFIDTPFGGEKSVQSEIKSPAKSNFEGKIQYKVKRKKGFFVLCVCVIYIEI
jgi:hypothetical protein